MLFSAGMWRTTGAVAAPLLLSLYDLGLVMAGMFLAPAATCLPPGTSDDLQSVMMNNPELNVASQPVADIRFGNTVGPNWSLNIGDDLHAAALSREA